MNLKFTEFVINLEGVQDIPYVGYKGLYYTSSISTNLWDKRSHEHKELLLKLENLKLLREKQELEEIIHNSCVKNAHIKQPSRSSERETERLKSQLTQRTAITTRRKVDAPNASLKYLLNDTAPHDRPTSAQRASGLLTMRKNNINSSTKNLSINFNSKTSRSPQSIQRISVTNYLERSGVRRIRQEDNSHIEVSHSSVPKHSPNSKKYPLNVSEKQYKHQGVFSKNPDLKKLLNKMKAKWEASQNSHNIKCENKNTYDEKLV